MTFLHNVDPFVLVYNAFQTGVHTLIVYLPGGGVVAETFSATAGIPFSIPNIFPENGTFSFRIIQPDGTDFDTGVECCVGSPGCSIQLTVLLVSCSPN